MAKRRWGRWPRRIAEEANSASGVFGLAGAGVVATGVVIAAPIVTVLGGALVVGTVGWCVLRACPPKLIDPQDVVGDHLTDLAKLKEIDPPLKRIGLVGVSLVGKTTLVSHLVGKKMVANVRADDPYAIVTVIAGQPLRYFALPLRYFALIDAAGQQYSQQFKVIDEADSIVVCLDHASSDASENIDNARLGQHEQFLDQLLGHLRSSLKTLQKVHFILNKRDLWERDPKRAELHAWVDSQLAVWRKMPGISVTNADHSNFKTDDMTALIELLREWTL